MTDSPKDIIAQAICDRSTSGHYFPWDTLTDPQREQWRNMAQAALDALAAAGYEIVKLPEPTGDWEEGQEWRGLIPSARRAAVWTGDQSGSLVMVQNIEPGSLSPDEARALAAALLAAAKTAGGTSNA